MTRDEIIDFLEWAKECGQLQFPESRKVDMAEMYIKEQDAVNKTCNIPHVIKSVCDVCGSDDVIEAPHMGKNCNRCHPL